MSTRGITAFARWCCLSLLACGGSPKDPPQDLGPPFFSASWASEFSEVRNCRHSIDHELHYIRVLAEPIGHDTYVNRDKPFPQGSVVIKAEYDDEECTHLIGFTAMKKGASGNSPSSGDWHFQKTDAGRKVLNADEPSCISCHAGCQPGQKGGWDWTCADP